LIVDLLTQADVGTAASKLPKVHIQLSIEGITIVDKATGVITDKYPLHAISFVAVDQAVSEPDAQG